MDNHDNGQPTQDDTVQSRRKILRSLGIASMLAAGAAQMVPAVAQTKTDMRGDMRTNMRIELPSTLKVDTKLATLNRTSLAQLKLTQRMPPNVNIQEMGLTPEAVAELTPAAKTLTKQDLVQLSNGTLTASTRELTVRDIGSIRRAFGTGYAPGRVASAAADIDVSCCCCTPCCCAAAVDVRQAA
jgi:hypothetical protein